jgi:hypothetical protein
VRDDVGSMAAVVWVLLLLYGSGGSSSRTAAVWVLLLYYSGDTGPCPPRCGSSSSMAVVWVFLLYDGGAGPPPLQQRRRGSSTSTVRLLHGTAPQCGTMAVGSNLGFASRDLGSGLWCFLLLKIGFWCQLTPKIQFLVSVNSS